MQLTKDTIDVTSNGGMAEDIRSTDENLSAATWISKENGNATLSVKRYDFEETEVCLI